MTSQSFAPGAGSLRSPAAGARYFRPIEVIAGLRAAERPPHDNCWKRADQVPLRGRVELRAAWLRRVSTTVARRLPSTAAEKERLQDADRSWLRG
jgi:hypothetical protein